MVADYALHLQCPWRIEGVAGTIVSSSDLQIYAGPGEEPDGWSYEDGLSLQARSLEALLGDRVPLGQQYYYRSGLVASAVEMRPLTCDLTINFATGHSLSVFALGAHEEQWRILGTDGDGDHLVYGA